MRVYCKVCGQRGRITKTNRLSDDVSDLYCQCTDAECGHSWVATLSFAHTKPLGQDHQPVGVELDGLAYARGAAVGTERSGRAVTSPDIFTSSITIRYSQVNIPYLIMFTSALLTCIKNLLKNQYNS